MKSIITILLHTTIYATIGIIGFTFISVTLCASLVSYLCRYIWNLYFLICRKYPTREWIINNPQSVMNYENKLLQFHETKQKHDKPTIKTFIKNEEVSFHVNGCVNNVKVHMICITDEEHTNDVVFIHGMNTGPIYFLQVFNSLVASGNNIYSIAVPGFGIVDMPQYVLKYNSEQIMDFYSEYLHSVIDRHIRSDKNKLIIVGHSFGAYISAYCYSKHPTLTDNLIFMNGIGLVSFTGRYGKWWSTFFKLGIPTFFMRNYFKHTLFLAYWYIISKKQTPIQTTELLYFMALLTCSGNYSDIICAKFISFNFLYSCWNFPIADMLLHKKLNIHFIWGIDDTIIPYNIAEIISSVSYCTEQVPFTLHLINGWHEPIKHNSGKDFISAFNHILELCETEDRFSDKYEERHYHKSSKLLQPMMEDKICGVYDVDKTSTHLKSMYHPFLSDEQFMKKAERNVTYLVKEEQIYCLLHKLK